MTRRITIAIVSILLSWVPCFSQIQAPMQVDTLYITSMQYHFDEIRPENWPFTYVLRTPGSFVFNGESFPIVSSDGYKSYITFRLRTNEGNSAELEYFQEDTGCTIKFSGYVLQCEKALNTAKENNSKLKSNAHLEGRTVDNAGLKWPVLKKVPENGCLVVDIWVDQYGKVVKAIPGGEGTTITDKALWNAARNAALETGFNMKADAPQLQHGRITSYFNGVRCTMKYSFDDDNSDDGVLTKEGQQCEEEPFQRVEIKPSFQGGDSNDFSKWVNQHLVYPEKAKENGIQGRVMLQFTIKTDGRVDNVKVLHGVDPSLDAEAVRVVSESPKWVPGETGGKKVDVTYTFPVIFQQR